ncbi:MAG: ribonuclease PH [Clostridia bacterium]
MARPDLRRNDEMRKVKIIKDFTKHAEGSVLIQMGDTWVLCNATVEDSVPPHVKGTGKGWVTAEYSMLPRSTNTRNRRDISKLKLSPRSTEIQRLIGRALRSVTDLEALGERSIIIDCDVLQADGGTRCASITGGFVALALAMRKLVDSGEIRRMPLTACVAAVSTGVYQDEPILDLCYEEDSNAAVDFNVVMTSNGDIIELQGTGEERPFTKKEMDKMLSLGKKGVQKLIREQAKVIGEF